MEIKKRKRASSIIPVSSMGDIAFLLLIFFMLSSIADAEKEIPVFLPQSKQTVEEKGKFFNIYITNRETGEYRYFYGFNSCSLDTIQLLTNFAQSKLLNLTPEMMAEYKALIRADKNVPYEYVNGALAALKDAGIHNVMLVSEKTK